MSKKIVLVTGASSGFGRIIANTVAAAGHTVYASMRGLSGKNAAKVAEIEAYAREHRVDLRSIELDVQSEASAETAVGKIIGAHGRLDVLVHNARHMVLGPARCSRPTSSPIAMTSTCSAPSGSTGRRCRTCARRAMGCWSG